MHAHHPLLSIAPGKLRPTRATVDMAEVLARRTEWATFRPGWTGAMA